MEVPSIDGVFQNKMAHEILDGKIQDHRYKVVQDVIYYKDRIILVPNSQLKDKAIREVHDSPLASHSGYLKTYRVPRERFSWKGVSRRMF